MKSITFKNKYGETIEIKRGKKKGIINIRHSDVDPKKFGQYHEFADRMKEPGVAEFFAKKGFDVLNPQCNEVVLNALEVFGAGYMLLHFKHYILNHEEVAMIRDAIKKLQ